MNAVATESQVTRPTTLSEITDLGAILLWSNAEPNAAGVIGVSRSLAYTMARTGEIPTLRVGRSIRVPVPALLALLGG